MPDPANVKPADTEQYTSTTLANGTPVLVAASYTKDPQETPTIVTLGTGFDSWRDLGDQAWHAIRTGENTRNITPETADELEGAEHARFFIPQAELTASEDYGDE